MQQMVGTALCAFAHLAKLQQFREPPMRNCASEARKRFTFAPRDDAFGVTS
jgi:hypothetical protein